jgi:arylsulfatase A-like enzyme
MAEGYVTVILKWWTESEHAGTKHLMRRAVAIVLCVGAVGAGVALFFRRPAADVPDHGLYEVLGRLGTPNGPRLDPPLVAKRMLLGSSTRDAMRVASHAPFEVEIDPAAALLVFSIGGQNLAGTGATFAIDAKNQGRWEQVFSATTGGEAGWKDYILDLRRVAPHAGTLRFEAVCPESEAGSKAQLYWGSTTLLRRSTTPHAPPNIILISLDTLGADRLTSFGNAPGVSPNIDAFLHQSFSFRRAYAQYPNTLVSHASMFTGLYPRHHGVYGATPMLRSKALASMLAENRYLTAAVTEDAYVGSGFGFDQGFDSFDNGGPKFVHLFRGGAKETFSAASSWLDTFGRWTRFFLFIHTYEVHTPYTTRDAEARAVVERLDPGYDGPHRDEYSGGEEESDHNTGERPVPEKVRKHLAALYAGEINYLDRIVSEFMNRLSGLGISERTLIVLTSDHGDEFGEHGKLGHGETLYNPVLHVVLGFHWPGHIAPGESESPVELIDVTPTVLDLAGLSEKLPLDGVSLLPAMRGEAGGAVARPAFAELQTATGECRKLHLPDSCRLDRLAVQGRRFKLMTSKAPEFQTLYDVLSDPHETRDVSTDFPDELRALRALLDAYATDSLPPAASPAAAPTIDPATRERLRALGYLE